ncbi:unnamed protein product [Moneuplotes crassus]|uniref:SCP domain-containing protein n=1 Tax=Euplotes crassus TaxID=5936 RepID=A0AAD1XDC8_EUPCR|nr:unnamed protein product [Moneuplotes crassus]
MGGGPSKPKKEKKPKSTQKKDKAKEKTKKKEKKKNKENKPPLIKNVFDQFMTEQIKNKEITPIEETKEDTTQKKTKNKKKKKEKSKSKNKNKNVAPNNNVSQTNNLTMNSLVNKMNSNFKPLGTPGFQGPINSSNNINEEHDLLDPYGSNLKPIFKSQLFSGDKLLLLCEEKFLPKPPEYCNPGVQEIFMALNLARTHPKMFCKRILSELESRYTDDEYTCISGVKIKTIEGVSALEQCIENLQQREPVMPLEWNKDLTEAAKDHVKDIGTNGLLGHESSSGLGIYDRILMNNDNQAVGMWAENIVFEVSDPVEIVALMLIDDGDSMKARRENALDPAHQIVGISFGSHVFKGYVTVCDFCREYIDDDKMFEMKMGIYDYQKEEQDD